MKTTVLIDNSRERPGRASLYEEPARVIRADAPGEVGSALAALQAALDAGAHLAGFFSYELGYALEPRIEGLMPAGGRVPLIWFGVFDEKRDLEGEEIEAYLIERGPGTYTLSDPELTMSAADYGHRFAAVKEYICAGDIYQLNLTLKGRLKFDGNPAALYLDLRRKQPVPHGAYIETAEWSVLSASPELFLEIDGAQATTRPMKGTAPRALTLAQDRETARWLSADLKSRAENLMIVDLMRNDLGRVAETGSVRVSDLYTVETYETLHQMTSGVEARLKAGTGIAELLHSIFPPGSIIGAPKVRAMEIIRELESEPRGIYTGAIGAFSPNGTTSFNVAIRTLTLHANGEAEVGIGSGVVHDSQAGAEYDECLLKMRFLTDPVREFQLIETMLHEPENGYTLLDRHMDRLAQSAEYFRFPFSRAETVDALERHVETLDNAPYRVRLLLHRDGRVSITDTQVPPQAGTADMSYVVSSHRVESSNPFLYHKTTERELYDGEWALMNDRLGSDEVVFLNERGEITEGSRTNVFARIGGELVTPALACGLLPGTLRADLLARGEVREAVLTLNDLARAEAVYLGNSVRGLVPARELAAEAAEVALTAAS